MATRVFLFASKSNPNAQPHKVRCHADGTVFSCSCRGFSTPNQCWHVRDVRTAFETGNFSGLQEEANPAQPSLSRMTEQLGLFDLASDAPKTPSPIAPMLASALDSDKTIEDYAGHEWVLEEKYDGHRLILLVWGEPTQHRTVLAWSRAGNLRDLPKHIMDAAVLLADGVYDGELYVPGGTSTDVTAIEKSHLRRLVLFDLLRAGAGLDSAMAEPGTARRVLLETAVRETSGDAITVAPQFPVTREGLHAIWNRGGEGAIIKHRDTRYQPGVRTKTWVKFKRFEPGRATITGFIEGKLGPCSRVVGIDAHGVEVKVKARNDEWRAKFERDPKSFIGKVLVFEHQGQAAKGRYRSPMADHIEE